MTEVPGSEWSEAQNFELNSKGPIAATWERVPGFVRHTFTHFHLELAVYRAHVEKSVSASKDAAPERCMWVPRCELEDQALPSLMRKVVAHALERIEA